MRVSFVYVMIGLCSMTMLFAEDVCSQSLDTMQVTVEMNNESLPQLFEKIQNQTGLLFAFRGPDVNRVQLITFTKQTASVKAILDLVFTNTLLQYRQVNNSVVVFERDAEIIQQDLTKQTVTGKVIDKENNSLPGVSIFIKGTSTGTTTDSNGNYSIDAKDEDVLVFTFIGYKPFETSPAARTVIDVVMEEDTKVLGEVVINGGYYETTDKLKTGSIVKVTAKEIERQPITSPLMALQGRVAGLEITPTSGIPGVAPTIRIRGNNSLRQGGLGFRDNGNGNYPLYVIDGVPVVSVPLNSFVGDGDPTLGGYDPLSTINPADIESIEVLKDGDATAIYGSRGANGVILITTKKNTRSNRSTSIDLSTYLGVGQVSKRMNLMNTSQYLEMRKEAFANDGTVPDMDGPPNVRAHDLLLWDQKRNTDWQELLIGGSAAITDVQVGVSAGTPNTSFRFSGNYHKETLVFPGDFGYQRMSGQLTANHVSENRKFSASFNGRYGFDKHRMFSATEMVNIALTLAPNAPKLFLQDGTLNWEVHNINGVDRSTWVNPYSYLRNTQDHQSFNVINNASLSYELLPDLFLSATGGFTNLISEEVFKQPISAQPPENQATSTGAANFNNNRRTTWIVEPKASYARKFGFHHLSLVAGTTLQKNTATRNLIMATRYPSDVLLGSLMGAGLTDILNDEFIEYKYSSLYGRFGYNWNERYLLNLTARRDGSSRFGSGNRFGNFWSVGTAWLFSNEEFFKRAIPAITHGKIRASYGITGSDQIGDYSYYNLYSILNQKYAGSIGVFPQAPFNPEFAWEETEKLEAAVELALFEDRVSTEISWYRNRTSNQLVSYPLSLVTGFNSVLLNFDATIQNTGWEFIIRGDLINSDSWTWSASMNFSAPQNKLIEFDGIEDSPYAEMYRVGKPTSLSLVYTFKGVNPETGLYEVVDRNNDGLFNDDDKTLKDLVGRTYYGGLTNSIQYKNFEMSFLLQFSYRTAPRFFVTSEPGRIGVNQPVDMLGRWQYPSDQSNIQRFANDCDCQNYDQAKRSDYNTLNASFIRLKTISLGWRLPSTWLERIRMQDAKIFLQGQNIFTLTRYPGFDPETGYGLPPLLIFTGGVQIKF